MIDVMNGINFLKFWMIVREYEKLVDVMYYVIGVVFVLIMFIFIFGNGGVMYVFIRIRNF